MDIFTPLKLTSTVLSIVGQVCKLLGIKSFIKPKNQMSVASRFFLLFENHGIHKNQIPGFFGHGLKLVDVKDEDSILIKLDEEILNDACEMFAVRREWLDGADSQIYPLHDFYKQPREFEAFICEIKSNDPDSLYAELIVSYDRLQEEDALLILEETIGYIGEKPIYRHHICNGWVFKYWKCRAYLAACIALSCKNKVWVKGYEVPIKEINRLKEGSQFIFSNDNQHNGFSTKTWYPEDMALLPDVYLNKIDPEKDNFGVRAALSLWLELYDKGLMHTDYPGENPRSRFEGALKLTARQ